LLRPGDAYGALMEGFGRRREKLITDGRSKLAASAALAESGGRGFAGMYYSAGAANAEFFEKNGIRDIMGRVRGTLRWPDSMAKLSSDVAGIQNRDAARTAFGTTDGQKGLNALGNMSVAKLQAAGGALKSYKQKKNALDSIEKDLASKGIARADFVNNAAWRDAKTAESVARTSGLPKDALNEQLTAAEFQAVMDNEQQANEFISKLSANGVVTDADQKRTIADVASALTNPEAREGDRESRSELARQIADRRAKASVAMSGAHAGFQEKVDEYRGKTYKPEHEYDEGQIVNNLLAHENQSDKYEFVGDLIQAAKQGKLESIMLKINPEFEMNKGGFEAFVKHAQSKMGMDRQEALTTLAKLQVYTGKDGKWTQSNIVKETPMGYELRGDEERSAAITGGINTKELLDVLIKSKPDGLAVKNAAGESKMHAGVIAALRQGDRLEKIITEDRELRRIPQAVLKELLKEAKALGIDQHRTRLENAIKEKP
jgi:hypothetical protein